MASRSNPDQFKSAVRNSFDSTPATYGTDGDFHWKFAERLVSRAPLQPGQTILDVATGTAPAAIMASAKVAPSGCVIGSDLSPGILSRAVGNIAREHASNIYLVASDAEALSIRASSIDGILCSSAIVWFPDIARALAEWHRVLQSSGWIAFSCFGGPARETTQAIVQQIVKPYGIDFPELNSLLNTPEKCKAMVEEAGFQDVTITIAEHQRFTTDAETSFRQAWAAGGRLNIQLNPEEMAQVEASYIEQFELIKEQDTWNHDYEQFVIGIKGR